MRNFQVPLFVSAYTDLSIPSNQGLTNITWSSSTFLNTTSGSLVQVNNLTTNTTYTVQATGTNGCTNTATKAITLDPCGNATQTNLKLFIQGYYTSNNAMTTVLANQGRPTLGGITDTILVELRNPTSPYGLATSTKAILYTNGTTTAYFNPVQNGYYYVVIIYRNTIETWSATPVLITNLSPYDFSTAAANALGSNQVALGNGQYELYSGDINQDGMMDVFDYLIQDPDIIAGNSGYLTSDLNGDGAVDIFDYLVLDPNIINGLGKVIPLCTHTVLCFVYV